MFIAEFLLCLASGKCLVLQEAQPVVFTTEEVCLDHAEARLPELKATYTYSYAIVRCVKLKGQRV